MKQSESEIDRMLKRLADRITPKMERRMRDSIPYMISAILALLAGILYLLLVAARR